MKATTPFLFFLSAGVQSFIGVEAYDGDQYEYQYQYSSSRDYTGQPEVSSEGGLPWFYYRGDGPPEMCKYSNLTPSQYYSLMCPDLDGRVQEIVPGYKVRFLCGRYGGHSGIQLPSSTPEQCAQLCEADPGCTGSSWLSDRKLCTLSGPLAAGSRSNTIYMQKVVDTPEREDPFAENCSGEFQRESADKFAECSRQQRDCVDQLGQCGNRIIQGEQKYSHQLNTCSMEKNQINIQLAQCNAERQSTKQCEQRNAEKDRQFSEQLISCEARNGKDKQQAALELSQQKVQYLQRVQELEAQLGESRSQLLSYQLDSVKQLDECNRRSSIEKENSDAQLATCRRDLENANSSSRERESALMRCKQGPNQ